MVPTTTLPTLTNVFVVTVAGRLLQASFKLHAPQGTVVQGRCVNGTMEGLEVTPARRMADVRVLGCKRH